MSRWWPVSVRRSTALSAALLCAVVFALGWLGTRQFLAAQLTGNAVNATRADLDRMADAYRVAASGGRSALTTAIASGDALFEVVADSGRVVVSSADLRRWDPAWAPLPPAPADAPADWTTTTSATLRPGEHPRWREYRTYTVLGRVVDAVPAELVEPLGREGSTLDSGLSGAGAGERQRLTLYLYVLPWNTLNTLRMFDDTLTFFVPLAVLLAALAAWFSAGRALRPVEAIRRELAEVGGHRLDRRVPVPPSRDEVARLALTTNETLDRLQHAHRRQERFVADASHELRSPLASLRTGLEVALAHPGRADWPAVAHRSLLDVQRLQRITADLLQLAVDPAGAAAPSGLVDLADVAREQVAERAAARGGPTIRSDVDGPAAVAGEPVQLERMLRNLLDNAVRHARSSVTVRVARSAGEVVLEVLDDGPGIPAADRERVFDRFVRLDDARARDTGGSGLGLTLARDIAVRHGGSLRVADGAQGARLVARLPSADPHGGGDPM
ncbi:sensor histidine kinase [Saccharothrix algeriensis]|uniref:histidine kinase n=1 Tax=Saccharothrix algeriensis TaxID=173560 RepID=A0A8T8HUW2_9PSEU|nr:HAMP domain-containing sensor histidine kinase [Saccharothrix algeriensis]MBM7813712.1 signal transduction histidine kinase [Saccharothrix algeriensis]QTR02177.1 HAMP domain-containing histidine kinase [Saccharothrix algeriensis]